MNLDRRHLVWALVIAAIGALGFWIAQSTEWVYEEVVDPVQGEARRDGSYRLMVLLRRLGATVQAPQNLDRLPPPGATLLLTSTYWDLFPERSAALQRWVEAGGHLVLPAWAPDADGRGWIPVRGAPARRGARPADGPTPQGGGDGGAGAGGDDADADAEDDDDENDGVPAAPRDPEPRIAPRTTPAPQRTPFVVPGQRRVVRCPVLSEPDTVVPAYAARSEFMSCLSSNITMRPQAPLLWALDSERGHVVARVAVGRGTVTVTRSMLPWNNEQLLEVDNALVAVAMLRPAPGREVWMVDTETRPPLLSFLWSHGAPAVLLGAAALAFALWRGAVRFGPKIAAAPLARRSMAEQIRGTARFIAHRGGAALHAAQLRALDDTARPRVRGFDAMIVGERAQAIAALTGLDPHTLARAMNPALNAAFSRHPSPALTLLETARRRLLQLGRRAPEPPSPSNR